MNTLSNRYHAKKRFADKIARNADRLGLTGAVREVYSFIAAGEASVGIVTLTTVFAAPHQMGMTSLLEAMVALQDRGLLHMIGARYYVSALV